MFVPYPQTHDYYPRHIDLMRWTDWQVILSILTYVSLIVLAVIGARKKRVYAFGILFFLITLSIVSNIVFPVGTNMSERFLYMPSLGWAIGIAGVLALFVKDRWQKILPILGVVLLAFSVLTVLRNRVWKSNYTLFLTDVETSSNSAKLLAAAAGELMARREEVPAGPLRDNRTRQAAEYLDKAQKIHPNYKLSYLLEGNAYYYLGEWDAAIGSYAQVVAMEPGSVEGNKNLGIAYRDAGRHYGEKEGDVAKALPYLNEALKYIPDDYELNHSLGVAYGLNRQPQYALQYFQKAAETDPDNATAHYNLGLAYQQVGDVANAQKHRDIAVQLDPGILERRRNRQE